MSKCVLTMSLLSIGKMAQGREKNRKLKRINQANFSCIIIITTSFQYDVWHQR